MYNKIQKNIPWKYITLLVQKKECMHMCDGHVFF